MKIANDNNALKLPFGSADTARGISSAVEHAVHIGAGGSSILSSPTTFSARDCTAILREDAPERSISLDEDFPYGGFSYGVSRDIFDAINKVEIDLESLPDSYEAWDFMGARNKWEITNIEAVVYFALGMRSGLIKIGFTTNLYMRKANLKTAATEPLTYFRMPGSKRLEKAYHRRFSAVRCHHEWFYPHPALFSIMQECAE